MSQDLSLTEQTASYLTCLGLNIKDARKARKWSQAEVAQRALMSRLTYAQIEKGAPQVQIGLYLRVLELFGLAEPIRHIAAPHLDEEGRRLRAQKNKTNKNKANKGA